MADVLILTNDEQHVGFEEEFPTWDTIKKYYCATSLSGWTNDSTGERYPELPEEPGYSSWSYTQPLYTADDKDLLALVQVVDAREAMMEATGHTLLPWEEALRSECQDILIAKATIAEAQKTQKFFVTFGAVDRVE